MTSKFQEGDSVYSPNHGWGTVTKISKDTSRKFPVHVDFFNGRVDFFIANGRAYLTDEIILFNKEEGKRLERIQFPPLRKIN